MTVNTMDGITNGLRRRAADGISGADALAWVRGQGLRGADARQLVAQIVREQGADGREAFDAEILARVAVADFRIGEAGLGFPHTSNSRGVVTAEESFALDRLREKGFITVVGDESMPLFRRTNLYALTDAGRARLDTTNH